MKNILFIAYHFPPTGGAPVQRTLSFVRHLLHLGYFPVVITGPKKSHERFTPQDHKLVDEIPTNVPVYRVDTSEPLERKGIARKIQNLLLLSSPFEKWWVPSAIKLGEYAYLKNDTKLIYATMSPFESAHAAFFLSNKIGIPWVADLRDAWVLDEIQTYPSIFHKKLRLRKMYKLLSTASLIIMNTPEATDKLKRTFPDFCKKRVLTITNGFNLYDFNNAIEKRKDKKFRIVHVGHFLLDSSHNRSIYEALGGAEPGIDVNTRSPLFLFKAVDELLKQKPDILNDLEIVFVGNASKNEKNLVESSKLSKITTFTGYLPRYDALNIVRTADMLFLSMHNLPPGKRSTSIPSKMYEYMASGRPILGAVPDGDARDFLAGCGTAFLCRPDDCDGMMRILCEVYDSWKNNKKTKLPNNEYLSQFERKNLTKMLAREKWGQVCL